MHPETRYAKAGGVNIAYQVVGDGPVDLVFVPGWVSHVEYAWEEPSVAPFLRRLARFSRLILMDRRGTGLSDPVEELPTLEERMDDVRAVLDAAGSERAVLFGVSESGPMCILFAATYPDRAIALVLVNTFACGRNTPDSPWMPTAEQIGELSSLIESGWGSGVTPKLFAPSRADDKAFVESWARFERRAVSPGGMRKIIAMIGETDVRHVLSSIHLPTLVLHRRGDRAIRVECGRDLAAKIAGATLVEIPGDDHFIWTEHSDAILDRVEEFVTGTQPGVEPDRVLATVLFTDIVDSTRRLSEVGDRRWRELLDQFYSVVRRELGRFRGHEIDTTGDGVFATFDGPGRGIRCAAAVRDAVSTLGIEIRAGLHTGECETIGTKVGGIAVHLGARVLGLAAPGEVLVSNTVKDLVAGAGFHFADRGTHELKGIPGEWRLFAVEGAASRA